MFDWLLIKQNAEQLYESGFLYFLTFKDNRFCGWVDVSLSENGIKEAHQAGKAIKDESLKFDTNWMKTYLVIRNTLNSVYIDKIFLS